MSSKFSNCYSSTQSELQITIFEKFNKPWNSGSNLPQKFGCPLRLVMSRWYWTQLTVISKLVKHINNGQSNALATTFEQSGNLWNGGSNCPPKFGCPSLLALER
jgi:hypothetical protein